MALSFAADIRPLFRDMPDVASMKENGLDLSSYEQVRRTPPGFTRCSKTAACRAMARGR